MDLNLLLILVAAAFVLAVAYAAVNYLLVRRLKEGSRRMQDIAAAIREGANAFLRYEYRSVAVIGCALALLLSLFIAWQTGVAFLLGAFLSGAAGFVGMKIATYANVRVAHTADETLSSALLMNGEKVFDFAIYNPENKAMEGVRYLWNCTASTDDVVLTNLVKA